MLKPIKTINMSIQFTNYKELLVNNNLKSLTYEERFALYCKDFPEMKNLSAIRDCELVQLYDALKRGYEIQPSIDALAKEWINDENCEYNDFSQELKSFIWYTSNEVCI